MLTLHLEASFSTGVAKFLQIGSNRQIFQNININSDIIYGNRIIVLVFQLLSCFHLLTSVTMFQLHTLFSLHIFFFFFCSFSGCTRNI